MRRNEKRHFFFLSFHILFYHCRFESNERKKEKKTYQLIAKINLKFSFAYNRPVLNEPGHMLVWIEDSVGGHLYSIKLENAKETKTIRSKSFEDVRPLVRPQDQGSWVYSHSCDPFCICLYVNFVKLVKFVNYVNQVNYVNFANYVNQENYVNYVDYLNFMI